MRYHLRIYNNSESLITYWGKKQERYSIRCGTVDCSHGLLFSFFSFFFHLSLSVVTKKVALRATLPHLSRTEQNRMFIGVKSIYKGLLPKQNIKYKTKKLLNTIKLHIHVWNACLINDIWYSINTWVVCVHLVFYQHMGCVCTFSILSTHGLCVYI